MTVPGRLVRFAVGVVLVVAVALWSVLPGLPIPAHALAAASAATQTAFTPTFLPDGAHLAPGVTLRLAALGRGDALTSVDTVVPTDDGTRVAYAHGNATEWYVRQGAGIEQGVTLAAPPAGSGPLALTIATPGAAVLVNEAGDAATLIVPGASGSDTKRFQYDGLHVTDATGRVLRSHLTDAAGSGIGIVVEDAGAVYPITVDPFVQQQTLSDPAATNNDNFGVAVALSTDGSTLAVGAYGTSSYQGKAYVYTRSGSTYALTTTLSDPAATNDDNFGYAVALSADGSTLAVGAMTRAASGQGVRVHPEREHLRPHDHAERSRRHEW